MRRTLGKLFAEYGVVAVALYLTIFGLVLGTAYVAIAAGWAPESIAGKTGTFVAAYVVTKLTQPFRIAGTLALTPFVAKTYERLTRPKSAA